MYNNRQSDMLWDLALECMQREVEANGSTISREQLEAVIECDPDSYIAERFYEYVAIAQATALTLRAMDAAGMDPRKVEPEVLMRAVEATRGVLGRQGQVAPDLDHDDGPSFG